MGEASGGLYCLGARFYDGETGRFITEDPVLGDVKTPLTLNRYSYSICDPINGKDPDGDFFFLILIAAIAIGAGIGGGSYAATHWGEEWDYGELGRSMLIGAAAGAISAALPGSGIAAAAAIGAGTGAGLYAADRTIEWAQTGTFEWNWADFGLSIGIGAIAGGASKALGNLLRSAGKSTPILSAQEQRAAAGLKSVFKHDFLPDGSLKFGYPSAAESLGNFMRLTDDMTKVICPNLKTSAISGLSYSGGTFGWDRLIEPTLESVFNAIGNMLWQHFRTPGSASQISYYI